MPPPGRRVDPASLVSNWQETFHELHDQARDQFVVTSNEIARFALTAADSRGLDGKLATSAWGEIRFAGDESTVACWNMRPTT